MSGESKLVAVKLQMLHSAREPVSEIVHVIPRALGPRLKKSFKALAVLWLCALISLPIPLLHFILVPSFVLAGIGAAVWLFLPSVAPADISSVRCIKCASANLECTDAGWPLTFDCPHCGAVMEARPDKAKVVH
jgi:predicted RNA-binding Zn-ribbon protein involved in translation (DUF1610 family)